jgi:hypothetical protein
MIIQTFSALRGRRHDDDDDDDDAATTTVLKGVERWECGSEIFFNP